MKNILSKIANNYRDLSHEEKTNHKKNKEEMKRMDNEFKKMKQRNDKWFSKL